MDIVAFEVEIGRAAVFADAHGRHDLALGSGVRQDRHLLHSLRIKEPYKLVSRDCLQRNDDGPVLQPSLNECAGGFLTDAIVDGNNNGRLVCDDGMVLPEEDSEI